MGNQQEKLNKPNHDNKAESRVLSIGQMESHTIFNSEHTNSNRSLLSGLNEHEANGYLVDGYIREEYISKYNDQTYPMALNTIIIQFLGSIFLRFDRIRDLYKYVIQEEGKLILSDTFAVFIIGCSLGFNKGINEIRIKSIKAKDDAIGIMSGITGLNDSAYDAEALISKLAGYKYWMYNRRGIWAQKDKTTLKKYVVKAVDGWKDGDIICIKVDCNQCKMGFYINGELKGGLMDIEPNMTYYLFMAVQWRDSQYRLLLQTIYT